MKQETFKNKKCLVTGGAGFIGSHLTEELVKLNAKVVVVDNLSTGKLQNLKSVENDIVFKKLDVSKQGVLNEVAQNCDFIFHLAANPSVEFSVQHPFESLQVNFLAVQNIIEAAIKHHIQKIVFSSSCAIYGSLQPPLSENMLPDPMSPYAVAKRSAELLLDSTSKTTQNFRWTALRYFNVFGPRQDPFSPYGAVIPKFITSILKDKNPIIFGDGLQTRDFVYVKQVVESNLKAASTVNTDFQVINIGNGKNISLLELLNIILEVTNKKLNPVFKPERKGDVKYSYANTKKMLELLGYYDKFTLKQAMQETIKWYETI